MTHRVGFLAVALLAAAIFAVAASASARTLYVLKHPKREHCKAHYVKKTRTVKHHRHKVKQTVCQYVAQGITPRPGKPPVIAPPSAVRPTVTVLSVSWEGFGRPYHVAVEGSVSVFDGAALDVPITYTIRNQNTGQPLGSFTKLTDGPQPCAILYKVENNTQTYVGGWVNNIAGCPLAAVSLPTGQVAQLVGSYAGDSTHQASESSAYTL